MPQISALEVDISLNSSNIIANKMTISITDNSKAAKSKGMPDGTLRGSVEATGSFEFDSYNFGLLLEDAKKAGSFRGMKPVDVLAHADAAVKLKVGAYGCKMKLSDVLDVDYTSEDGLVHKVEFYVTGKDFIKINDVPYLDSDEVAHLR